MAPNLQKTYSTRSTRPVLPSSPPSELTSSPPSLKRKRSLLEPLTSQNAPPAKKSMRMLKSGAKTDKKSQKGKENPKQKQLTQLHFSIDSSILRTCPLCHLSYTKGAPDDESLHRAHCARVQRGLEWGREEEKETVKSGVEEVVCGVKLKNGSKGRIICFRADVGGKIGAKLSILLETVNLTLSSPPLSSTALQASKVYLFLMSSSLAQISTSSSRREKIVGCAIAQRISAAMAIASEADVSSEASHATSSSKRPPGLIPVDTSTNLYVHPNPLPTPLGIPRLFVSSSHRRLGIASRLLSAAAETFIHGCPLDPAKGEVAFSQPTGAGKGVLEKWGKGGVRIYEES